MTFQLNLIALLITASPVSVTEAPSLIPETHKSLSSIEQTVEESKIKLELAPFHFDPMGTHPNSYPYGQCTYGVASMKGNIPDWGNANQWDDNARASNITVTDVPIKGAVAQTDRGAYGHVAEVLDVNPGSVTIEEMNYDYNGSVRVREAPVNEFVYIWL